jgi:Tfp pilus assembly protein PilO
LQGLQRTATETHQRLPALPLDREFVSEVRQVADRVGMEILDHRLSPQQKVATHSQTEVSFRCRGSYASICKFLSEIEQLARLTKVSKLELESDDYLDRYPFQVSFVLYYGLATNDTNERRAELSGDRL